MKSINSGEEAEEEEEKKRKGNSMPRKRSSFRGAQNNPFVSRLGFRCFLFLFLFLFIVALDGGGGASSLYTIHRYSSLSSYVYMQKHLARK